MITLAVSENDGLRPPPFQGEGAHRPAVPDHAYGAGPRDLSISGEKLRLALLWLTGASGAIVFIEPSPYEITSFLSLIMFALGGLTLSPTLMPLVFLLVVINIGYSLSGATVIGEQGVIAWLATSWYLAVTAIFFAAMLTQNTEARLRAIAAGCITGGAIASLAAVIGYFRVVPSLSELLLLYDRARGTFKDPNVLGAFLVFPALLCLLMVVSARFGRALKGAMLLGLMIIAVLLSFSRAAWGQTAYTAVVMLGLIFITTRSPPQRLRIVLLAIAGVAVLAAGLAVLLSIDIVAKLFAERASFSQSYDVGAQGRFARHFLGALLALDYPVGIGPLQFNKYFPEDPHNSYLNAFMAGGWLGGVAYPALVFLTLGFGIRTVFIRTPYQQMTIAVFAGYFGVATESFIIDTDHWRHTFLLMGLMWGLIAASRPYIRPRQPAELAPAGGAS